MPLFYHATYLISRLIKRLPNSILNGFAVRYSPNSGAFVAPSTPFGVEEYTIDIYDLLLELGIGKTHFWGTHTGSAIGLLLTYLYPERIESLILEGTFLPGFSMPRVQQLLERAKRLAKSVGVEKAKSDWLDHADWFENIRKHSKKCNFEKHNKMVSEFKGEPLLCDLTPRDVTSLADKLHFIAQPTLVYNGEHDMEHF